MGGVIGYRLSVIGVWLRVMGLLVFLSFFLAACAAQYDYQVSENVQKQTEYPYTFDFGKVKEGEIVKHDFVLKNDSQKILNIKNVNASCGCTVPKIEKKELLPGESALIEVQFNSKGYSGAVQQFVYVNTDDIDNPILRYIIKAEVIK